MNQKTPDLYTPIEHIAWETIKRLHKTVEQNNRYPILNIRLEAQNEIHFVLHQFDWLLTIDQLTAYEKALAHLQIEASFDRIFADTSHAYLNHMYTRCGGKTFRQKHFRQKALTQLEQRIANWNQINLNQI